MITEETCHFDEDAFDSIIGQLEEIAREHLIEQHHLQVSLAGDHAGPILKKLAEQDALVKSMRRTLAMTRESMQALRKTNAEIRRLVKCNDSE